VAIVNSIATFSGVGAQLIATPGVVILTAVPQTARVPLAGSISPAVTRGYWRMKLYNQTVAISFTSIQLQAGDGTNLVTIDEFAPPAAIAITATAWVDACGDFIFDSLPSASAGGATGAVINFGATFFNFLISTTGAGGTAAADLEIAAEP
jgi:hypothetical protein